MRTVLFAFFILFVSFSAHAKTYSCTAKDQSHVVRLQVVRSWIAGYYIKIDDGSNVKYSIDGSQLSATPPGLPEGSYIMTEPPSVGLLNYMLGGGLALILDAKLHGGGDGGILARAMTKNIDSYEVGTVYDCVRD